MSASIQRRLWSLLGNGQRLDGGAMFGNAPRALWTRWIKPDEANRIPLACRALLIEERDEAGGIRRILCEAGIGAAFPPKLRERFGVTSSRHELIHSLEAIGLSPAEIDIIVLSHLHFDHAGGLLEPWEEGAPARLSFPKARYVIGEEAWARACDPPPRDRASFLPELIELLRAHPHVERVAREESETLGPAYRFHRSDGHTPGQLLIEVPSEEGPVVFCGDLVPGTPWVHLPITMGYDRNPELLIDEKSALYRELLPRGGRLFFTHDSTRSLGRLCQDERGRYAVEATQATLEGFLI